MMYTQDKRHVPDRVELKGLLSEFRDALEEEIDKIKKSGQSSTLLFGGRQIESHGADLWYRFNVEYVPSLPADTPCKLVIGKDQFDVTVISFEENSIVISIKSPLPDTIGKARLENGATVLMERLIKCIEENAEKENPAGNRMLPSDGGVYPVKKIFEYSDLTLNAGNTQSQNNAIVSALSSDITYIWGPPGTGKTTVIGQIIDELYKHDRSVLVVSHTNTAVDGAIEKADKTYSKSNQDTGVPQGKSHSRLNCFSAAVSVDLAFKFLENKLKELDPATAEPEKEASVLIVAPYKPHVARINQLVELEYHNRGFKENLNFIRAGTIHSFQGSEADIVIFDLVIDEPHWKANLFMTDKEVNEDLRKMFNVAVTRAKFKLYIVGNFAYCQKRAKNNALSELLDKLIKKDRLVKVDAKTLLPEIVFARQSDFAFDGNLTGKHIVCREDVFNDYFMADIHSFKKRLIVYSAFMTEARLSTLLPAFSDAVRAGKQIIVVTKALSDRGKSELAQYQKCEKELRDIGVSVLHKKGMHEKLIFVDSNAVWIGSLNALSFTGLTGEVMQRHADRELTAEYEKLFDIEHICNAIENTYEQKCPICGDEMIVKESDEGGIYWQCVAGDYSRNVAQQYPLDGILRCKCGAPYVFAMKNEPRWVCSADSKHYQKMRESDLKLEKMAALIPTKAARSQVNKYFFAKKKELEAKKKAAAPQKTATMKKASKSKDDSDQMKMF